jgi:ABC-type sulfate transport system permease component
MVRPGNRKGIHDWNDLTQPGLQILTPDPAQSGGAKWNIVAAYGAAMRGKVPVRTVLPVLLELDPAEEEAARVLGAGRWMTFRKVMFPALRPATAAGALLAFARSLGEFGAIVVVSGNIPGRTLTAPVFIFQLTSQLRGPEASAVSTMLFALSFLLVLVTERLVARPADALWT